MCAAAPGPPPLGSPPLPAAQRAGRAYVLPVQSSPNTNVSSASHSAAVAAHTIPCSPLAGSCLAARDPEIKPLRARPLPHHRVRKRQLSHGCKTPAATSASAAPVFAGSAPPPSLRPSTAFAIPTSAIDRRCCSLPARLGSGPLIPRKWVRSVLCPARPLTRVARHVSPASPNAGPQSKSLSRNCVLRGSSGLHVLGAHSERAFTVPRQRRALPAGRPRRLLSRPCAPRASTAACPST